MGIERIFKHLATITRRIPYTSVSSLGLSAYNQPEAADDVSDEDDFAFDDGSIDGAQEPKVVFKNYPCQITESTSYQTSEQGENYTGKANMKGLLTDLLQEGDIVDDQYKILGDPQIVHGKYTQCNLVRIS